MSDSPKYSVTIRQADGSQLHEQSVDHLIVAHPGTQGRCQVVLLGEHSRLAQMLFTLLTACDESLREDVMEQYQLWQDLRQSPPTKEEPCPEST